MNIKKVFLVSHTNWDREWYLPYEGYRFRMAKTLDKLLQIFDENPHFRHFTWDGHTIFIEDYLQLRPHKREKLRYYIKQGRLQVGPWYTMPDEFLVSGEALIRNLLLGTQIAKNYGNVMRVGYLVDTFGHISQMPQILEGFGIDEAIIWRGVGSEIDSLEFEWEAPNGSKVLVTQLADHGGYSNMDPVSRDRQEFINLIRDFQFRLSSYSPTGYLLIMNGKDYSEPQEYLPNILEQLDYHIGEVEIIHSTIPSYMEAVRQVSPSLQTWRGELYSCEKATILGDVRSTRRGTKQKNWEVEVLLEKWTEPMASWAWLLGKEYPRDFLVQAWKYLLQCHLHDPICGSCIDEVEEAMAQRFYGAKVLAEEILDESVRCICSSVNTSELKSERIPLVVFNSTSNSTTDCVEALVWYPDEAKNLVVRDINGELVPCQIGERECTTIFSFLFTKDNLPELSDRIRGVAYNIEGNIAERLKIVSMRIKNRLKTDKMLEVFLYPVREGAFQEISTQHIMEEIESFIRQNHTPNFRLNVKIAHKIPLLFLAEKVPGVGYKTYLVEESSSDPTFRSGVRCKSPYYLENKWYKVEINRKDGTLNIKDKINSVIYKRCNQFIDEGDAGDTNNFCPPEENGLVDQSQDPPTVSLVEDGPVRTTVRINMVLLLPQSLSEDRTSRSTQKIGCPVTVNLSLYSHVNRIDFQVNVENKARDHRLRVYFPTPIHTDYSFSESNFDVVKRPIDVPQGEGWVEKPTGIYPHQSFVDVTDGQKGVAIANKGIPEFQVMRGSDGIIVALTLLRCIGHLGRSDLTNRRGAGAPLQDIPGAQCLGTYCFEYSFISHQGTWHTSQIQQRAHEFESPLRAYQTNIHPGALPLEQHFVKIEPNCLVLSAIKQSEENENLIVRLYNPTSTKVVGKVALFTTFDKVSSVRLDETKNITESLVEDEASGIQLQVPAKSIETLRFIFTKSS